MFNEYPYTDYHELNTDWIIGKIKNVETAEANTKQYAEDADAAKVAAEDAKDIAVAAKETAVEAKDDAVEAKDDAVSFLNDTKDQLDLLQARVDNIIPDGTQTAGNTELLDVRVAYNGYTYDSAGNAVRGQVDDLHYVADPMFADAPLSSDAVSITLNDNSYWNTETDTAVYTNFTGMYRAANAIAVNPGEIYDINLPIGSSARTHGVVIVDSSYKILEKYGHGVAEQFKKHIVIPANGAYLLLTSFNSDKVSDVLKTGTVSFANDKEVKGIEDNTFRSAEVIKTVVNADSYWSIETDPVSQVALVGNYKSLDAIEVSLGETYYISIEVGPSGRQRAWLLVDENYKLLENAVGTTGVQNYTVTVTNEAAKYLLITTVSTTTPISVSKKCAQVNYFKNMKLSLLGDSFSAFAGTIPAGNRVYYNGSNSGVERYSDMWWYNVCKTLNLDPLVINGWSGSCVTSGVRDDNTYKPSSDASRCSTGGLDNGVDTPDIVLIAMGVNDYSYDAPVGSWDGTSALNDDTSTFRTAYATMLKRIQSAYPDALVVCITPWFMQRGTDTGATYINSLGLTEAAYADAVREIAGIMNCPVIEGKDIGFNRYNYYPTYCNDDPAVPCHPNANGQFVIGVTVAEELRRICNGYGLFNN